MKSTTIKKYSSSNWQDVTSLKQWRVIKVTNYLLTNGVLNIMEKIKLIKQENHNLLEDKI